MGGVLLPGPSGQAANPAYAAFPGKWDGEGFQVPVGLLRFLPLFTDTSPFTYFTDPTAFRNNFDFLSAYDQATHLGSFLLNPARSPDEVVFNVSANGISITDGQGNSLMPTFQVGTASDKPSASSEAHRHGDAVHGSAHQGRLVGGKGQIQIKGFQVKAGP